MPKSGEYFFTPFLAKTDYYSGRVYYRVVKNDTDLARLSKEIRSAAPLKFAAFTATHAYAITWYKMASYYDTSRTNTYQCVLVTNQLNSFLIFNYDKLDYALAYKNYFNSYDKHYAQVDINAGDGRTFYTVEDSYSSQINVTMATTSNVRKPGKHIFRVDAYDKHMNKTSSSSSRSFLVRPRPLSLLSSKHVLISVTIIVIAIASLAILIVKLK